jgi:ubiquinone/menaquinone biosynthesis C-methylase UbiE
LSIDQLPLVSQTEAVNRAFSKQSCGYDRVDNVNIILRDLREQVYRHVAERMKPGSHILELNAGTGLDALHFVSRGHYVHATDISDGMIAQVREKIRINNLSEKLTCQRLSFEDLDEVAGKSFDYVFSNFGGLNCIQDLYRVTRHLPALLRPGGYVTWVIMPPVCPWELSWILKGQWKKAFRRFEKSGTLAHVEGEYFKTYYHPLKKIRSAFGPSFKLVRAEGLAALSPPPHRGDFPLGHPRVYKFLRKLDRFFGRKFPFNRWADHVVVTFRYVSESSVNGQS